MAHVESWSCKYICLYMRGLRRPWLLPGKSLHLIFGPIPPHVVCAKVSNLVLQMSPKDLAEFVHDQLHLWQPQFGLAITTFPQILLQFVQPVVDQGMLTDQMLVVLEHGHALGERRVELLFFNHVMHGDAAAQIEALGDKGPDRHALGP